jgi:hypothetical protein
MTEQLRKYVTKTRGRPFAPGNPGRPKGSRNKATLAAEALLDGEAEALTRKAIELALAGDVTAEVRLRKLEAAMGHKPIATIWWGEQSESELQAAIAEREAKGFRVVVVSWQR